MVCDETVVETGSGRQFRHGLSEDGAVGLDLRHRYAAGRGYLGAATLGLPADVTREAVRRDLERAARLLAPASGPTY